MVLASLTVATIVCDPFTANVVVNVEVVAPAWTTLSTDHVNEYGEVPPEGVAVQVTGLPAVAVPQVMLTAKG